MEVKEQNKYNNFGENSTKDQLEQILDNPTGVENSQIKQKDIEKKVFLQKADFQTKEGKERLFKDLGWYWSIIKKPVIILAGLEILLYILSVFPSLRLLMTEVFDPILLLVILVFFGRVVWQVKAKKGETLWQAIVTVFMAGFTLGLILSIFKAVWIREYWTIFNLTTEPVFMGLVAVAVGLVVGLVAKKK